MQPTVGRIVHYYEAGSRVPHAALVVATDPWVNVVDLQVFGRGGGVRFEPAVPEQFEANGWGWTWPPRA